jgi:hypothetical protein
MAAESANFEFLRSQDIQLVRLGALAERYFSDDPNTCVMKLRQFGERLAQLTYLRNKLPQSLLKPIKPQQRSISMKMRHGSLLISSCGKQGGKQIAKAYATARVSDRRKEGT